MKTDIVFSLFCGIIKGYPRRTKANSAARGAGGDVLERDGYQVLAAAYLLHIRSRRDVRDTALGVLAALALLSYCMLSLGWTLIPVFGVLLAVLIVLSYAAYSILMKNVDKYYCAG